MMTPPKTWLLNNAETLVSSFYIDSKGYFTKYDTLTKTRKAHSESIIKKYTVDCNPDSITVECEKNVKPEEQG